MVHPPGQQQQGEEDEEGDPEPATAPEGTRLISCCPGLRSLHMNGLRVDAQLLAPLTGLSSLTNLGLAPPHGTEAPGLAAVCQMTRLRRLNIWHDEEDTELLLQLTQLRLLTSITYRGRWQGLVRSLGATQVGAVPFFEDT